MASAVYQLFSEGFSTLSPWAWQQCFERGDIRIPDIHESGKHGSFLDVVLEAALQKCRAGVGSWSVDKDDGRFEPDAESERLALWLVNQGCDPWVPHQQRNSWLRALELGWPSLMAALSQHPQAPAKEVLESACVPRAPHSTGFQVCAPASFARRNQIQALRAWHQLGLDVNLGVAEGPSAGSEAQTPEFLEAWANLGGLVQARDKAGKSWPDRWSFSTAARHIAMEKAWAKFQEGVQVSPVDAVEALLAKLPSMGKGRVQHDLQQHQINWSSPDRSGVPLRDRVLERYAKVPDSVAGSVVEFALEKATPAQLRATLEAGLKARGPGAKNTVYPNAEQLTSVLVRERLGDESKALKTLADAIHDQPGGVGFGMLLGASREASRSFAQELNQQPHIAAASGYEKALLRAVAFWTPWFCERADDGAMKGWKAFAAWALRAVSSNGGGPNHELWKRLVGAQEPNVLLEGKNLLRASEILRAPPDSEERLDLVWNPGSAQSFQAWTQPLVGLAGLEASSPDFMRSIEAPMWEEAFKNNRRLRSMVEPRLRAEALVTLEDRLPSANTSAPRPRM